MSQRRMAPVRVLWPLPRWVWWLCRLMPARIQRAYWAVIVPADGEYMIWNAEEEERRCE